MSKIDERAKIVRRLSSRIVKSIEGDTGESGETYDAEAKAEAWTSSRATSQL